MKVKSQSVRNCNPITVRKFHNLRHSLLQHPDKHVCSDAVEEKEKDIEELYVHYMHERYGHLWWYVQVFSTVHPTIQSLFNETDLTSRIFKCPLHFIGVCLFLSVCVSVYIVSVCEVCLCVSSCQFVCFWGRVRLPSPITTPLWFCCSQKNLHDQHQLK